MSFAFRKRGVPEKAVGRDVESAREVRSEPSSRATAMKVGSRVGVERNSHRFPFVGTELLGKCYGAKHWPIHPGVTYKVEFLDRFAGCSNFVEDRQHFTLAFDCTRYDLVRRADFRFLSSNRIGNDRKLLATFAVERRVNNDDDARHGSSGRKQEFRVQASACVVTTATI